MDDRAYLITRLLSVAMDVIVPMIILFAFPLPRRAGDGRLMLTIGRFASAILITAILFAIKIMLLIPTGIGFFGLVHMAYDSLVFAAPIVAWFVLILPGRFARPVRRSTTVTAACLVIGFIAPAMYIYATWIEPFRVQFESHHVALDPSRAGSHPIRIGVLADIQTGHVTDHERRAVDALMAKQPDLILLPGDLFAGDDEALEGERRALLELLAKLDAPGGVYFAPGNCELLYDERAMLADAPNVTILDDEIARVAIHDRTITLAGIELDCESKAAVRIMEELETHEGADDIRILMAHKPDAVLHLPDHESCRTDLVIAGHTHGGQVVIPFYGPPITLSHVPRAVGAGGLHDMNGRMIYVSRGLGWEDNRAPRVRFLCPPEITLLTLE